MTSFHVSDGSIIQFDYVNWKHEHSFRTVAPMTIFYGSNAYHKKEQWLMIAYDLEKETLRTFAMDQMSNMTVKDGVHNA